MPFAITGVLMYLQSRTRRWLQTLRNANTQLHSAVAAVAAFEAARAQRARVLGEQEHKVMTMLARDYIDLTLGSQPLSPGSWLETTLRDVIQAREQFAYGDLDLQPRVVRYFSFFVLQRFPSDVLV
jgi:hypothetical protein